MTTNLADKTANIFNDLPFTAESDTSTLKQCVGGDTLDTEMKGVQVPRKIKPVASMLFTSNALPALIDSTGGTARRMIDFEFSHKVTREFGEKFSLKKLNAEIPQFTLYCLWMFHRWLDDSDKYNPFELSATMKKQQQDWVDISNPVMSFFDRFVGKSSKKGVAISRTDLYNVYLLYTESTSGNVKRAMSPKKFYEQVEKQLHVKVDRPHLNDAVAYHVSAVYKDNKAVDQDPTQDNTEMKVTTVSIKKRIRDYAGLYLRIDAMRDLLEEMAGNGQFIQHLNPKDKINIPDIIYAGGSSLCSVSECVSSSVLNNFKTTSL